MGVDDLDSGVGNRVSVAAMEAIVGKTFKVLDQGFIRVVDYMGDDSAVVQAARVSYGKGTKHVSKDAQLINYLMSHHHTTPFEMCELKLHVKLPIFVARQWIRHRTANVNEYSARYSVLDGDFYLPSAEVVAYQSEHNNQGRGEVLPLDKAAEFIDVLKEDSLRCRSNYESSVEHNLAREIARLHLNLNCYTQWYWKSDLHNLLHFLKLRADPSAQYEIREYARVILEQIVKIWVPLVYDAFNNYVLGARNFSAKELDVLKRMLAGDSVMPEDSGLTKREWKAMMSVLGQS